MAYDPADKFSADPSEVTITKNPSLCRKCRHFLVAEPGNTCRAYPDGVPDIFMDGRQEHRQPYEGDNGIQFESWREEG